MRLCKHFPQGFNPARIDELHAWMTTMMQPLPVSDEDWQAILYERRFLESSEPGQKVTELRQLLKTKSTFLAPMLGVDRIHPELKQMSDGEYGVKFGRFSLRRPKPPGIPEAQQEYRPDRPTSHRPRPWHDPL